MKSTSILLIGLLTGFCACATNAQERSKEEDARLEARSESREQLLLRAADAASARVVATTEREKAALKRVEVSSRLLAELLSGTDPDPAVLEMATSFRRDLRGSVDDRLEVAWLQEMLLRKSEHFESRDEWLAAREASARELIGEFPASSSAYDELWSVAVSSNAQYALAIAGELKNSPASEAVRKAASDLLHRHEINGLNASAALADTPGARQLLRSFDGKAVVFYTWMPESADSIARAQALGAALPNDWIAIGINLGPDVAKALRTASEFELPGSQLYEGRAHDSPVVKELTLTVPGLLFGISREGILHDLGRPTDVATALKILDARTTR
jgi:hypothetical protein